MKIRFKDEYLSKGWSREISLKIDAGGSLNLPTFETVRDNKHSIVQDGKLFLNTQLLTWPDAR
jgi:3-oxoacyl-[acyl-carrier-protein] synthase-3